LKAGVTENKAGKKPAAKLKKRSHPR